METAGVRFLQGGPMEPPVVEVADFTQAVRLLVEPRKGDEEEPVF